MLQLLSITQILQHIIQLLAEYNAKIAEANKLTGVNGNLSKVASQNLIFEKEKNANVTFSGQYDPYDGE